MSIQAVSWAIAQYVPSAGQKLVLIVLANHTNHETGQCNPSRETLAEETSMSARTIQRRIAELIEMGLVRSEENFRDDGARASNQYYLSITDTPPGQPDTPPGHRCPGALDTAVQAIEPELEPLSEAKASGASAPVDPREIVFGPCLEWLANETGKPPNALRGFLGKLRQLAGNDDAALVALFRECHVAQPADPLSWLRARLKPHDDIPDVRAALAAV